MTGPDSKIAKTSHIQEQMEIQSGLIDNLIMTIDELAKRLDPILTPDNPSKINGVDDKSDQVMSQLPFKLKTNNAIIKSSIDRLRNIQNRCEL